MELGHQSNPFVPTATATNVRAHGGNDDSSNHIVSFSFVAFVIDECKESEVNRCKFLSLTSSRRVNPANLSP